MKKFLLSSALVMLVVAAFGQTCPSNAKRNNGNACTGGGTGGGIEVEFLTNPPDNLQILAILSSQGVATVIEATRVESARAGKWYIDWCFETDNVGPVSQGGVQYQFYLDVAPFNEYNGETIVLCTQASLPVILGNFNAVNKSGKVSLTWETFQEVENAGFEVQRRVGAGKYETVAFIASKVIGGTGSGTAYSFDDNAPLTKGVTYYRLRQVDLNGQAAFSEVKALRGLGSPIVVSVYPNPSRGTTNVAIPEGTGTMDVTLDDFAGRSVQRWNGLNVRNLQLTNLKPGMYLLRITIRETGEQITERIAVQ